MWLNLKRTEIAGRGIDRLPWYIAIGSCAAILIATAVRIHFGVDFTDGSFYIAIPYRLVLGAHPFVDETSMFELPAAILTYPFVFAYYHLFGVGGIVLFMRHVHLAFTVIVAALLWIALGSTRGRKPTNLVIASLGVAFVPFGIHGLSYNTFGAGFFCAGVFTLLTSVAQPSRRKSIGAGSLFGLAVFTYPAFAIGCLLSLLAGAALSWRRQRTQTIVGFGTFAVWCLATVGFFFQHGWSTTVTLYHQAKLFGGQGGGFQKAVDVGSATLRHSHPYLVLAVVAISFAFRRLGRHRLALSALGIVPFLALVAGGSWDSANNFVSNTALLAPVVFVARGAPRRDWPLMAVVWLPALVAGEGAAFGSGNGSVNFGIGAFPGAVASLVLLCDTAESLPRRTMSGSPLAGILALVPALATAAVLTVFQYTYVYRDSGFASLRHEVGSGPFSGLYTSSDHLGLIHDLQTDLETVSGPTCRIMFYRQFPAGYLFDAGIPWTNRAFILDVWSSQLDPYERILLNYYKSAGLPDVVVQVANAPSISSESYVQRSPLEKLLTGRRYELVGFRYEYKIYRRVGVTCK